MARAGATVVIHFHRNESAAEQLVSEICENGGVAWPIGADVSDEQDVARFMRTVCERRSKLDVLVNNAGAHVNKAALDVMSSEQIRRVLDVNLLGAVYVTKAAIPLLREAESASIVNVSSIAAISGGTTGSHMYAAAKGGLEAFTRSMAKELAPSVRVNAVSPAAVRTAFHDEVTSDERWARLQDAVPLKRLGTVEDTANTILFLAGSGASYITGQVIQVSGGRDLSFYVFPDVTLKSIADAAAFDVTQCIDYGLCEPRIAG